MVTRYIAETEIDMGGIFGEAEEDGAFLLFQDRDTPLGSRSEVKDGHDRYAIIDIGYPLGRVQHHHGLTNRTTNMKDRIDSAFTRRLQCIVEFLISEAMVRVLIWERNKLADNLTSRFSLLKHLQPTVPLHSIKTLG